MCDPDPKDIPLENCPFCKKPAKYEESMEHRYKTFHLGCSDYNCIAWHIRQDAPMHCAVEDIYGWNERNNA